MVAVAAARKRRASFELTFDGPFFTKDPAKTFRQNVRVFMASLARAGEGEARRRAFSAPRKAMGPSRSAAAIRGRVRSLQGRQWAVSMVVSIDQSGMTGPEAVRSQAAMAGRRVAVGKDGRNRGVTRGHEGTAKVFSGTARALRTVVAKEAAKLTEGLN